MGRRALRTKSGRLRTRERRRRLTGVEPGAVVVLDAQGRIAKKGVRTRGMRLELAVQGQGLTMDMDMRKLVELVATRLAQHYRSSLRSGVDPTGKALPAIKPRGGAKRSFGVLTGKLAERWTLGKIRGNHFRASVAIFPVRDAARQEAVRNWLNRKTDRVEVMNIRGEAEQVISSAVNEWVALAVGEGVDTPEHALTGGQWVELPDLEAMQRWPEDGIGALGIGAVSEALFYTSSKARSSRKKKRT